MTSNELLCDICVTSVCNTDVTEMRYNKKNAVRGDYSDEELVEQQQKPYYDIFNYIRNIDVGIF